MLLSGRPAAWQTLPLAPILCRNLAEVLAADVTAHPLRRRCRRQRALADGIVPFGSAGIPGRPATPGASRGFQSEVPQLPRLPLLAANAVVFLSGRNGDFHVVAVNRTDRWLLWDVKLPAQPVLGGLSLTRAGDVLVPLVDGRVVCIGS